MLEIVVPGQEYFDETINEFINVKGQTLLLEHSLESISKWESKWHKAFLGKKEKTDEETLDYIRCMTLNRVEDQDVYKHLTRENRNQIHDYLENPMTATYLRKNDREGHSNETVTSELIYYWMIALQIPMECQKWHLNRLLMLIQVCNLKNKPPKKRSKGDIMRSNAALNAARRQKYNSKG